MMVCAVVLSGCTTSTAPQKCTSDALCGAGRICAKSGECLCSDNRGCGRGEFCNGGHRCQVIAGCLDNSDCEATGGAALICDVKRGQCASADQCFDDSHCPFGKFCDQQSNSCAPGCRDEGDCPSKQGCIKDSPSDVLGKCVKGSCGFTSQCPNGNNCDLTTHRCVPDQRGPFCGACTRFDPLHPQCGDYANYCLIDTGDPARQAHYCGVDCSQNQGCPAGYDCKPVIIVGPPATPACGLEGCVNGRCSISGTNCARAEECPQGPPGGDCHRAHNGICAGSQNRACTADADCGGSQGSCHFSTCKQRESAAYGFCTCLVDSDCQADDCRDQDLSDPAHPIAGHCLISGHRCYGATDCETIACVNGGCLIGSNCKPNSDRRCLDLQSQP